MKLKSVVTLMFALVYLSGCIDKNSIYIPEVDKGGENYAKGFSNSTTINIDIKSVIPDAFYSIYFENPYNEDGDLKASCILQGTTPIQTTLSVPKNIDKLYILGNNEIMTHTISDVVIDNKSKGNFVKTRSNEQLSQEVLDLINNKYFPERTNNVRGNNLYKCTDISISQASSSIKFNEADVCLTYISDGNLSISHMFGKIWFYTYPADKYKNIKLNDCTFYGRNSNNEIIEVPYNQLSTIDSNNEGGNPIFWSKVENENLKKGIPTKINLGRFPKGINVGFAFKGSGERVQFTTPALNLSGDTHNYIGSTIEYKDGTGNFHIEKPVGNGFICHVKTNDFEGNVIGMENRTPNHSAYDGDYNDMLCILDTDPVDLKSQEEISMDEVGSFTTTSGLLLFEDNYPQKGDYDFNDVVIKYCILDYYKTNNYRKDITSSIVAKGCNFKNEFGYYNGSEYTPIFKDIKGYKNVSADNINLDNVETQTVTIYGKKIIPYLNNGSGYISSYTFNTDSFPYVLDIPISKDGEMFRWCIESKKIDEAYNFAGQRPLNWFETPKNEELVVKP